MRTRKDQRRDQQLCQSKQRGEKEREKYSARSKSQEIDQHALKDGSRSEKGTTRVDLFPYVSGRRNESCKSAGLESLNKEPKGWKGLGRQSCPCKAARSAANSIKLRGAALVVYTGRDGVQDGMQDETGGGVVSRCFRFR